MDAQREQQEEAEIENSYSKEISSLDDAIDDCIACRSNTIVF